MDEEALALIGDHEPEVIFIEMPGLSGLAMVRRLEAEKRPLVVFITAVEQYAVEAFAVGAVHYLVKPYGADEVEAALRRVRDALASHAAGATLAQFVSGLQQQRAGEAIQRVIVKRNGRALLLRIDQIDWFGGRRQTHASIE